MKRLWSIVGLEGYAVALAALHMFRGVVTDEAKYLLNIPYPHPPLVRTLMNMTEWMPIQELFWRVVIATIVVQAVWFVWSMSRELTVRQRGFLAAGWLLSAAVVLQAGTVMMAPLTAVQALIFVWLLQKPHLVQRYPAYVALFWLAGLWTAYQIVLFAPIVWLVLWRTTLPRWQRVTAFAAPMLLLGLYTLINPLIPASVLLVGKQNAALAPLQRIEYVVLLWALGGNVILSALGTLGMAVKRRWELLLTLALLAVYVCFSFRLYYAFLFTPLFIAGAAAAPRVLCCLHTRVVLFLLIGVMFVLRFAPPFQPGTARQVGNMLQGVSGSVLIHGSYGHQWQYELRQPVYQFHEQRVDDAVAVVCLEECEAPEGFSVTEVDGVEMWLKRE